MNTNENAVSLLIGGKVHSDWSSYEVDSDLLTPADAWRVTLSLPTGQLPEAVTAGAPVNIRVGGELVMVGHVDGVYVSVSGEGTHFDIAGRDGAATLLDCSAPIATRLEVSLDDIIAMVGHKLGIKRHRVDADSTRRRKKFSVNPGETAWDTLVHVAESNGLWPWFDPDGTLVVGGPDYDAAPVATLILRKSGRGNNVLSLMRQSSVTGRYSEVTVLNQHRGSALEQGAHAMRATELDTSIKWYRPLIVTDSELESVADCRARARKIISDGRLNSLTLRAMVAGHRIVAPGQPSDGQLWKPGQRIKVISEPHGFEDVFFMMARRFTGGRDQGPRTLLTLKEDRTWLLDAHPAKNKHRLNKKAAEKVIFSSFSGELDTFNDGLG